MDVSIAIDPWLVIVLLAAFIALRVWHPITALVKKRKTPTPTITTEKFRAPMPPPRPNR